ncbi:hypothetical protein F0L68_15540 [Solihabitans fulvus]|uniref:Uncharacterized protein n=1 Tax=Solihabitans fulvus TaxID=1892852 RepID=A0A5B2XF36_9PSEU|nr:hypothetical protein [Solihabitans fulvus]KAA2261665.1 hypothetical protein F0L68_15540 [Solihabitans fulvus]
MHEDELRSTFDQLHARQPLPSGLRAEDIVQRGHRVRRRRRQLAVAGTSLTTGAVAVLVMLLAPGHAPQQIGPANVNHPAVTSDPTVTSDPGPQRTTPPTRPWTTSGLTTPRTEPTGTGSRRPNPSTSSSAHGPAGTTAPGGTPSTAQLTG